ncbi:DUF2878 domain-containing protein [Trichloromonas sp.]|uniref:DUF2878 domain-containing protein n=1 Tax=Trichloromonas sp. TaxID=3069249 RepID=UPI003D81AF1A
MTWRRNLINVILFQLAWFAAVLGAARGLPWLGPLALLPVVGVHLALSDNRDKELILLVSAGALGFCFDTTLVATGTFVPIGHLLPFPFSPPWMVGLWMNFATTLNVSLAWLRNRYLAAVLFGAVGGPLAYYSGARLGATVGHPSPEGLTLLALGWGLMTPLLFWLAGRLVRAPESNGR